MSSLLVRLRRPTHRPLRGLRQRAFAPLRSHPLRGAYRAFLPGGNESASASLINYYRTEEIMQRKGFTLIELLVVIAIIAVLIAPDTSLTAL